MKSQQEAASKTPEASRSRASSLTPFERKLIERPTRAVGRMVMRVVTIYVVVGALWIVVSDPLLNFLVHDPNLVMKVSVVKGWAYVAVTALLLYYLLRQEMQHWLAERTAREEAEATVIESEARFRQLFELAPLPIGKCSWDGKVANFNARFFQVFGYTAEEIPTLKEWALLGYPDEDYRKQSLARWEALVKRAEKEQTYMDPEEFRITCKNGDVRTFLFSVTWMKDGVLVAFVDITDRKKVEAALEEKTELFRQMAENIDEVFWVTAVEQNKILYVSPAYEKTWGRSCESLYVNPGSWAEAIHPEDRLGVLAAATIRQPGEGYAETYRILHPSGDVRWVHVRSFPVSDSAGKIYRFVGVAADITERRKLEEQFRHAQKMEALGTLAGGIAHDFNNILGAITGFAELTKLDSQQSTVQDSQNEILSACNRAGMMVRQILAFSRQQEQQRKPIQLWRVVEEATRLLRAVIPTTIEFQVELDQQAPTVFADPSQVHQVVMNLCTNAVHAMAGQNGRLGVKIETFHADEVFVRMHPKGRVGRYACLSVRDTGHGIAPAIMDRIFEPFYTTKAPGEGTGLGLSVVHGIVQNHEGIITVDSRPGEGALFNVYLPEYTGNVEDAPADVAHEARGRGQRILVVDDEDSLVQMTAKILTKLGYAAEKETDPVAALARLRSAPHLYDLVITDLTMPQMTGLQLAANLLEIEPAIPVIMMSGFLANLSEDQLRAAGIKEVLLKPVTLNVLSVVIDRVLKSQ